MVLKASAQFLLIYLVKKRRLIKQFFDDVILRVISLIQSYIETLGGQGPDPGGEPRLELQVRRFCML